MTDNVADALNNDLHMLILQVTQNCNLRCKYCIYSGSYINRRHNNKRMDFTIAKKAIDYYIRHSSQLQKLKDFYAVATEQNDVNYESSICHSEDYDVELAYDRFKKIYCTLRNIDICNQPLVDGYLVSIKKNIADELKRDVSGLREAHPGAHVFLVYNVYL